jgi:hypothetical protein
MARARSRVVDADASSRSRVRMPAATVTKTVHTIARLTESGRWVPRHPASSLKHRHDLRAPLPSYKRHFWRNWIPAALDIVHRRFALPEIGMGEGINDIESFSEQHTSMSTIAALFLTVIIPTLQHAASSAAIIDLHVNSLGKVYMLLSLATLEISTMTIILCTVALFGLNGTHSNDQLNHLCRTAWFELRVPVWAFIMTLYLMTPLFAVEVVVRYNRWDVLPADWAGDGVFDEGGAFSYTLLFLLLTMVPSALFNVYFVTKLIASAMQTHVVFSADASPHARAERTIVSTHAAKPFYAHPTATELRRHLRDYNHLFGPKTPFGNPEPDHFRRYVFQVTELQPPTYCARRSNLCCCAALQLLCAALPCCGFAL